jgi:Zn-dependent protease
MTSSFADYFAQLAILIPTYLVSISFHEFSHAFVAYKLGDDTGERMGRMTLNPIAHFDFFGFLCLLLFGIGWAKPVPFDDRNFKHPKTYSILTSLVGPVSNFLLALAIMYIMAYFPLQFFSHTFAITFSQMFQTMASFNVMLGVFNLIPIPPLDGSRVLTMFLVDRFPNFVMWLYQYAFILVILFVYFPPTLAFLWKLSHVTELLLWKLVF